MTVRYLADGQPIQIIETGEGSPLVFVHGLPGQASDFTTCMAGLPGYHCIAYDRVGYGGSVPFQSGREPGVTGSARELIELLDLLALPRAVLAGWSYGGHIVLEAAHQFPDRVQAVVLIGSAGPAFRWPGSWEDRLLFKTPVAGALVRMLHRLGPGALRSKLDAAVGCPVSDEDALAFWQLLNCPGTIDHWLMEGRIWQPSSSPASRVTQPCLVIHGADDSRVGVGVGKHLSDLLQHSTLHVIEGAGHWPFKTHTGEVAALISSFMSEVYAEEARSSAGSNAKPS